MGLLTKGPVVVTQVSAHTAHPGEGRGAGGGHCRLAAGRLLGLLALLLASVVVTRLLLASGAGVLAFATATTSSTASLSSGGDGGEKRRVLLHRLLYSGYQVRFLAVHGPQLVGFSDEEPNILVVVFAQLMGID